MHRSEFGKPTNTARLAQLTLVNCRTFIVGERSGPPDLSSLVVEGTQPIVLFPDDAAPILDKVYVRSVGRPVTLIVPDGTWKQARKLRKRLPQLHEYPKVRLPIAAPSAYRLRRNQLEGGLCTIEAIARALGILEKAELQMAIEKYFAMMVERVLWSRSTSRTFPPSLLDAEILASKDGA